LTIARALENLDGSPVSARIAATETAETPRNRSGHLPDTQLVEQLQHGGLDAGQLLADDRPVPQRGQRALQRARPLGQHSGAVTQRRVDRGGDAHTDPGGAPRAEPGASRVDELALPGRVHRLEVPVLAGQRHAQAGQPRRGRHRVGGRTQHGWPGDLQQVAQLLLARAGLGDQTGAARAQMTQPRPPGAGLLGQVAVQLPGQPGDEHRVLVVVLPACVVLGLTGPGHHQRLHAHQRHTPAGGQLLQDHPPVAGGLARHRDPGEPGRQRRTSRPLQQVAQLPWRAPRPPPRQHTRVVIGQRGSLPRLRQIDPEDRMIARQYRPQRCQPGVPVRISPSHAVATLTHRRPPCVVGTPSPSSHREDALVINPTATGHY
jgi:hypothetical protein